MGNWPILEVAEYPVEIIDGDRGNKYPKTSDFENKGYCLFLNAGNVTTGGFSFNQCAFISEERDRKLKKGRLKRSDTVVTTRGTVGNFALFDSSVSFERIRINSGMVILRPDPSQLVPRFLYYSVKSPVFMGQVKALTSGSAQPQLPIRDIRKLKLPLPPMPEQFRISQVIGALDDKIELNRQTNETLEEMARAIFKDWFVDFGPTRRKMAGLSDPVEILGGLLLDAAKADALVALFPDSIGENGQPGGWERAALEKLGSITTGKTPSKSKDTYYGEEVPFLKIPDMHGKMYALKTSDNLSQEGSDSQIKKMMPAGSVSVSCIATPGLVVLNHRETHTNQQINTVTPTHQEVSNFVYWVCQNLAEDVILGGSGGSVFHNMNKGTFEKLTVLHPPIDLKKSFSLTVSSLHRLILANEQENQALAATRDLLLPKLMSGEIRLKDVEVVV